MPILSSTRKLVLLALLCPVTFACAFVLGRSTVPASTPPLEGAFSLPLIYSGAPIPVSLSSAPSIAPIKLTRTAAHPATHSAPATSQTPPSTPTPVIAPPAVAPTPLTTPASHPQHHTSRTVPFDSSG